MVMAMRAGTLGLVGVLLPVNLSMGSRYLPSLLGAAVMFEEIRPPPWKSVAAGTAVAVFAIFHGYAHGTELLPGQSALCSTQHGLRHRDWLSSRTRDRYWHGPSLGPGAQKVLRAAGGLVAVGGAFFMWKAIA